MRHGYDCPDCLRHMDEINRLRRIIADLDQRIIRDTARRSEFADQMEAQLTRLRESQQLLDNELRAGR